MARIVKKPEVRRAEILGVADSLFQTQGYEATSVDEIVRTAKIAKGTFYHYFKSKEDVLDALASELTAKMLSHAKIVADASNMGAIEKFCAVIAELNRVQDSGQTIVDGFHRPENRELHDRSNIETVLAFGPLLAAIVEQGCREGVFQVEDALGTVQFILAGSMFMFGHGVFHWTEEEEASRMQAMLLLIERAFGAEPGSFAAALGATLKDRN